jgi:hypothetical protein
MHRKHLHHHLLNCARALKSPLRCSMPLAYQEPLAPPLRSFCHRGCVTSSVEPTTGSGWSAHSALLRHRGGLTISFPSSADHTSHRSGWLDRDEISRLAEVLNRTVTIRSCLPAEEDDAFPVWSLVPAEFLGDVLSKIKVREQTHVPSLCTINLPSLVVVPYPKNLSKCAIKGQGVRANTRPIPFYNEPAVASRGAIPKKLEQVCSKGSRCEREHTSHPFVQRTCRR